MGNGSTSTAALVLSVIAIIIIIIVVIALLFTTRGQTESRNLVNWIIAENEETDATSTFAPQNNTIFKNSATAALTLTISAPSGITSRGNFFKVLNLSTQPITLATASPVTAPQGGVTIPAGKTFSYIWESNKNFIFLDSS